MVPLMKAWIYYKYLMMGCVKSLREYYVRAVGTGQASQAMA